MYLGTPYPKINKEKEKEMATVNILQQVGNIVLEERKNAPNTEAGFEFFRSSAFMCLSPILYSRQNAIFSFAILKSAALCCALGLFQLHLQPSASSEKSPCSWRGWMTTFEIIVTLRW